MGNGGGREVCCFNGLNFPQALQSQGNAPVMENVERRSCLSAANFPHLPVLLVRTPQTSPPYTQKTVLGTEKVGRAGEMVKAQEGK